MMLTSSNLRLSLDEISIFWQRYPALPYGLTLLLATLAKLSHPLALVPLLIIIPTTPMPSRLLLLATVGCTLATRTPLPEKTAAGKGIFRIEGISRAHHGGWIYRGNLKSFNSNYLKIKNLPCSIYAKKRLPASYLYSIEGTLKLRKNKRAQLKSKVAWEQADPIWSLVEWRIRAKERVKTYLSHAFPSKEAATFLTGLVTGELGDRVLQAEFAKLGLAHILAISGFHFALLAYALHFGLSLLFPPKMSAALLLATLAAYFLFVGNAPSIQRAWIMATFYLIGQLIEKRALGLNSLGLALCAALLLNPHAAVSLGFQLSFLATGGILLLFGHVDALLQRWIPKAPFQEVKGRPLFAQHLYLAASLFRSALALTLAVHLALLPLLLFHFHTFQLHSLFYNLFFPCLVSLSVFLLMAGVLIPWLHTLNSAYTGALLKIVETPPFPPKTLYFESISPLFVLLYLTLLFLIPLSTRKNQEFSYL